ncbi:MAG: TIGR03000 domain-containing protein [Pirellulaceae bacterium]
MSYLRVCAYAVAVAAVVSFSANANAGGSFGGSSGGSSGGVSHGSSGGGGLFSGLRARLASRCSGGSASSGGSSGGGISSGSHGGSSGGGGLLARLKARQSSGSCGGSTGSSGGYVVAHSGSSGGSVGSGSSGGRVGPLKKLVANIRARRASNGSSGGSSGGYVSSGSSGGSSGGFSYSPSVVSYVTPVSYSSPISYETPVQTISYGASADTYESPVIESSYDTYSPIGETIIDGSYDQGVISSGSIIDGGTIIDGGSSVIDSGTIIDSAPTTDGHSASHEVRKTAIDADAALLTVAVPNDSAKVTVNGHETKSSGSVRQFMSRGLEDGFVYTYVVKVQYDFNGTPKTDSKEVKLRSGQTEQVVFEPAKEDAKPAAEDSAAAAQPVITVVKLHVPSGAKVNLAGTDTNGKGEIRTFRTKSLKAGDSWTNYTVRVTANVGGQDVSKEQTVNVAAGSTTELSFDFDAADVAKN